MERKARNVVSLVSAKDLWQFSLRYCLIPSQPWTALASGMDKFKANVPIFSDESIRAAYNRPCYLGLRSLEARSRKAA